jgi:hypothetical protein
MLSITDAYLLFGSFASCDNTMYHKTKTTHSCRLCYQSNHTEFCDNKDVTLKRILIVVLPRFCFFVAVFEK